MIYLDNASTTALAPEVKTVLEEGFNVFGNPGSMHVVGKGALEAVQKARATLAYAVGCKPEEIIFTSGATESNNLALLGIMQQHDKKKRLITTKIEHPSVLEPARWLEKWGYPVVYLDVDKEGFISLEQLEKELQKENVALVSIMHGNHEIGTLQDLKIIGALCKKYKVIFHTDATQTFMKHDLHVAEDPVQLPDLITFSSHKLHGPKGVGALYVRKSIQLQPIVRGGGQELGLRSGTENVLGIMGFAAAVELAEQADGEDFQQMQELQTLLVKHLLRFSHVQLNGPKDLKKRLVNNVHVSILGKEGDSVVLSLSKKDICISTGATCSTRDPRPSPILKAIQLNDKEIRGSLRISISRYTTQKDIEAFLKTLQSLL